MTSNRYADAASGQRPSQMLLWAPGVLLLGRCGEYRLRYSETSESLTTELPCTERLITWIISVARDCDIAIATRSVPVLALISD